MDLKTSTKPPLVHLHVHLDGSVRHQTLFELAKDKGIEFPVSAATVEELRYNVVTTVPGNLAQFLAGFSDYVYPVIKGDLDAMKRIATEFCEDEASQNVIYVEARFSPHLLATETVTSKAVLEAVLDGFNEGQRRFNIIAKVILCCMRDRPEWSTSVVELATQYRDRGVVGVDLAGNEAFPGLAHKSAFDMAAAAGLGITVHAGEAGPAQNVVEALDDLHASRIGHGYHIIDDAKVYEQVKQRSVHFECCFTSSLITGAQEDDEETHAIARFLQDDVNFSLSSDDPAMFGKHIAGDIRIVQKRFGITDDRLRKLVHNAVQAAFCDEDTKKTLADMVGNE